MPAAAALSITASLSACWVAPRADVVPSGSPRTIQEEIVVVSDQGERTLQSVDTRTHSLTIAGAAPSETITYHVSRAVSGLEQLPPGARVRLQIAQSLTVYVAGPHLERASIESRTDGAEDARVLTVDSSYRVLTVQFPDARTESYKVGLNVNLRAMEPGDAVLMRPIEVVAILRRRS